MRAQPRAIPNQALKPLRRAGAAVRQDLAPPPVTPEQQAGPRRGGAPAVPPTAAERSQLSLDPQAGLEALLEDLQALLGKASPLSKLVFTDGSEVFDRLPYSSDDSPLVDGSSSSDDSPLYDKPTSSDDSPLYDEPTSSPDTPLDPPGGSEEASKVVILGSLKRPRTVAGYLEVMQQRGIALPFDPATLPADVLQREVPGGSSVIFSESGELLGMKDTAEIKGNASLGVGAHGEKRGKKHLSKAERTETTGTGGSIELDGQTYDVARTFLKSPVMLDLNGDGQLGVTGVSTAKDRIDNQLGRTVSFDIDGDGDLDQTEWMAGDGDGMLVDDRDGGATRAMGTDGRIDGTRLYGDQGGRYGNGYEKLAQHDANGDGVLTGSELEGLKTWIDDGDARLEAGELKSLAELGVTELDTRMTLNRNARGEALMQSSFVRDGKRQLTEDVWFRTR